VAKVSSTPNNPAFAVLNGIKKVIRDCGVEPGMINLVLHGTTVATNALLEQRAAITALLTTEGFRDILSIGRQNRPHLYDFRALKPPPLIPRRHTYEVKERMLYNGEIMTPLDETQVAETAALLRRKGIFSVAVSLLHAYKNPRHEVRIKEIFKIKHPGALVTLSSEIMPEFREYERTCTTAINALVRPKIDFYLESLETGLKESGINGNLLVMHSGGGVLTAARARTESARTVFSGPAGGVLAGAGISREAASGNVITLDMGGTSTDICLIRKGAPGYTSEGEIGGYPLRLPMIDIHTIGAGGGSIAWLDSGGALRVGPSSAGASPGPACYGLGGTEPTVTDANLLLGRINRFTPLGDKKNLDLELAGSAIAEKIAKPLGIEPGAAAKGILTVVNANMARAVRVASIQRGHDLREYTLMAFGGAGPLHGAALARELGMPQVIIPRFPGVTSALGMLQADVRLDFSRTYIDCLEDVTPAILERYYGVMEREGKENLLHDGFNDSQIILNRSADLRYAGQSCEITLPVPGGTLARPDLDRVRASFHLVHKQQYGWGREDSKIELVNLRLAAVGKLTKTFNPPVHEGSVMPEPSCFRKVYFSQYVNTPVYRREDLAPGFALRGPAVVEQEDATVLIFGGMSVECDREGNLIIKTEVR